MTLPRERTNAIAITREFLKELLDPKKTPKVPRSIREKAHYCLKHYPGDFYIGLAAKKSPDVFGEK